MFSTVLTLALLVAPASAQAALAATQSTDMYGQPLVNALGDLAAKQRAAEARMRSLAGQLKKANDRIETLETAKADGSTDGGSTSSTTPDPAISAALAAAAEAKDAYEAATAEYEALQQMLATAQANPQATVQVTEVRHTNTVEEVRSSGFRPILYAGPQMIIAEPAGDVTGAIEARVTVGGRPTWDLANGHAFGLAVEGSYLVGGGWGVRALAIGLTDTEIGGLGLGLGVGYNCDVYRAGVCGAERPGAVGQFSWEIGQGIFGLMATAGLEINGVEIVIDDEVETGTEARGILGINGVFGRVGKQKTVTVSR